MRRALLAACLPILMLSGLLCPSLGAAAQQAELKVAAVDSARSQYVAMAFHDVVDQISNGDENAVTSSNLVSFFEWLHANGWTAITLDDIENARSGKRPLPSHAILITFDDGYRSLYTRVYPLLLVYKIPVVAALVGCWMESQRQETVKAGDDVIPGTDALITWEQAREMQRSGLVEFGAHSYCLHKSHQANPQGGHEPAAATRTFDPAEGYETEEAFRNRIRADLEQARTLMEKELGRAPRAAIWPYGRYTAVGEEAAQEAQYKFLLTMDPEPGFPEELPRIARLLPVRDPNLPMKATRIVPNPSGAVRMVHLDPAMLQPADSAAFEKALGAAIERVRALGATTVVVDAASRGPQNRLESAWFPNHVVPVKADVLSRIVWQMHTRGHVNVAVSLPFTAARATAANDAEFLRMYTDLGTNILADALFIDEPSGLAAIPADRSSSAMRWDVRQRRHAIDMASLPPQDALALRAFFAFEREIPAAQLFLLSSPGSKAPSSVADLTLVETPPNRKQFRQSVEALAAAGWFVPEFRYRFGVWIRAGDPPSADVLSTNVRVFQRHGGVAFGWEPDDPVHDQPKAALAAPSVSAATFPLLRKP